jgi:hypothetical protein
MLFSLQFVNLSHFCVVRLQLLTVYFEFSGSFVSLILGSIFASFIVLATLTNNNYLLIGKSVCISVVTRIFSGTIAARASLMGYRYHKSGKVIPAGVMCLPRFVIIV